MLCVVGIATLLYLIALVINWRDQPPSAATIKLHQVIENRPAVADDDNGYAYLLGFSAPHDVDPQDVGVRRMALLQQDRHDLVAAEDNSVPASLGLREARSPDVQALIDACKPADSNCDTALEQGRSALSEWLSSEAVLLDRYRALLRRKDWLELIPDDPQAPLPRYADVLDGQRLHFASLWQLSEAGDVSAVREGLERDVAFWRRVLQSSDLLLTKMVATAALKHHFAFGNLVLRRLRFDEAMQAVPPGWMKPLSDDERSMSRPMAGELLFAESLLRDLHTPSYRHAEESLVSRLSNTLSVPMYQPQDTINRLANENLAVAEAFAVPLDRYPAVIEQMRTRAIDAPTFPTRIYNMMGAMLADLTSLPHYEQWCVRVGDIEGMRRAALLAAELRSRSVPPAQVAEELRISKLRNPYDDAPFGWSEKERAIVFVGLQEESLGTHAYVY